MIEVHLSYNVKPGIDEQIYVEWIKAEIIQLFKMQQVVELHAHHNLKQDSSVLVVAELESLEKWEEYSQSAEWNSLVDTLQRLFALNLRIEVWQPSPFLPVPLCRPGENRP